MDFGLLIDCEDKIWSMILVYKIWFMGCERVNFDLDG
jgi:hypothetical protein